MKLTELYLKIKNFTENQSQSLRENSTCKKGCAQCCYVDLSVFSVEANYIKNWFKGLSDEKKRELMRLWALQTTQKENFHRELVNACVFLKNEECTVYEVRPLICRTQGLAMQFREDGENFIDICPLNDRLIPQVKDQDILNLDLANKIISQLELADAGGKIRKRVQLSDLQHELRLPSS